MKKNKDYKEAKKIILGGNMLLSKRPEMFLPDYWPSYYKKAFKTFVIDSEGKKYIDMICAVGQNTLGYSNSKINSKVISASRLGNMSTLNSYEEVRLTKEILKIHKWADMAKYARSGGEANAIAIRIARSAAKNHKVAVCGYHGWHDWYLSANLKIKDNLKNHLLPGLSTSGVPKNLKNTVFTFNYGNFEQLKKIVNRHHIGVIKMEVSRGSLPDINFLKKVRKICDQKKIILIFDECTSGFRRNFGGLHLTTGVNPDLAMFGKALGNGYAITAVIGKKKIMKKASNSFISSTFWTERIGFAAALETLSEMRRLKSWKKITMSGRFFNNELKKITKKIDLDLEISGIESITSFKFNYKNHLAYKTFITQEMLKKGYLASNLTFFNIYHTTKVIKDYLIKLEKILLKIKHFEKNKINPKKFLKSDICHETFKRLND